MTAHALAPMPSPERRAELPLRTQIAIFLRLLAIQGSWNYEILLGNGIGFCLEPALRLLPEGIHSQHFKDALARESKYFNAHPYLASVAVGALARAELDGEPPERIERFRTALCGPLGSVGDRLVWAGWLPFCSLLALLVFGLGAGPALVLLVFLGSYNIGHFARSFTLSNKIDQQQIRAQLDDGVLTLTLKKAQEARPRRIEIS